MFDIKNYLNSSFKSQRKYSVKLIQSCHTAHWGYFEHFKVFLKIQADSGFLKFFCKPQTSVFEKKKLASESY